MVKRKTPLEPTSRRKRTYELPNLLNVRVQPDPLREIETQIFRDLSDEYRALKIETMIEATRKRLDKSAPASNIHLQKENLEYFKTVMDLAKMNQPKDQPDRTLEYLKFFNTVTQNQGAPPNFFDQYIKGRELGIFGQPSTGDSNTSDVEIEKLRGERMLNSKRLDLELTKLRLEQDAKRDTLGMVGQFLAPFVAFGGGKLAEDMQARGMRAGAGMHNLGNPSQGILPNSLQGQTAELHFKCTCGYDKVLVVPSPPPPQITCPGCGESLNTGPPPLGDLETSAQWRPQA